MAQTLEAIKGGGGSIKVGTTGTINALMLRELQSVKVPSPPNNAAMDTKPKPKVQIDEATASCSGGTTTNEKETGGGSRKPKHHHARTASRNPFLRSDSVDGNGTPGRKKNDKKASCIVEIVDVKCGVPDKAWANPITNKLKKLSFSKLSV
ncbi:hypothetical protein L1887_25512 [Cichorium endivia]|nr:hypothetical protein L1887_25512 [Cichorium endivia]